MAYRPAPLPLHLRRRFRPGQPVLWKKPWWGRHKLVPATVVRESESRGGFRVLIESGGRQIWVYDHTLVVDDDPGIDET